jgi:peptide/nickel transport system substrate-binding protein
VAVGAGSVWVANSGAGTVTRIDPARGAAIATIVVGGSPQQIAVAGDRVWATVDARTLPRPGSAVSGGTLRVVATHDITAMDPALAYDPLSWELLYASCAKLLNYPDKSGPGSSQLVPEVAQSLPVRSADGRSYTFTIRRGFRFSPPSNAPVTAQTLKDTIERTLNPEIKSPVAGEFRDIVGAGAYIDGRARHISGVVAKGNALTLRLLAPAPDLLARIAEPAMCAVPPNTPIDPSGVHVIPSAGPYRVASYAPGQGVVLTRNPNYAGSRPHVLERIEVSVNVSAARAISRVEAGKADYAIDGAVTSADAARRLAQRYGTGSAAARAGRPRYFVDTSPELDFLALNSQRPLFRDVRLRKAVNFAVDREALARIGDPYVMLADAPADHYIPPGVPGYRDVHLYPRTPDLGEARRFARGHAGSTAVLYTCDQHTCEAQAQILKTDLAAIGLRTEVKRFPIPTLYAKLATPGEPFDIGAVSWVLNYPDPDAMLNYFLERRQVIPPLADHGVAARLTAAARLSGPDRYLTYARLDAELARTSAPLVAYGSSAAHELFSARVRCQAYGFYGTDVAALCVRNGAR